jgi:hypothetical protein
MCPVTLNKIAEKIMEKKHFERGGRSTNYFFNVCLRPPTALEMKGVPDEVEPSQKERR